MLPLLSLCCYNIWAQEEAVQRSSHPRGFASGASLPPIIAPAAKTHSGSTTTSASIPPSSSGQSTQQGTASGGVNLIGNTRIDAHAQGATSSAVGQQNATGNRVGTIGGK